MDFHLEREATGGVAVLDELLEVFDAFDDGVPRSGKLIPLQLEFFDGSLGCLQVVGDLVHLRHGGTLNPSSFAAAASGVLPPAPLLVADTSTSISSNQGTDTPLARSTSSPRRPSGPSFADGPGYQLFFAHELQNPVLEHALAAA